MNKKYINKTSSWGDYYVRPHESYHTTYVSLRFFVFVTFSVRICVCVSVYSFAFARTNTLKHSTYISIILERLLSAVVRCCCCFSLRLSPTSLPLRDVCGVLLCYVCMLSGFSRMRSIITARHQHGFGARKKVPYYRCAFSGSRGSN